MILILKLILKKYSKLKRDDNDGPLYTYTPTIIKTFVQDFINYAKYRCFCCSGVSMRFWLYSQNVFKEKLITPKNSRIHALILRLVKVCHRIPFKISFPTIYSKLVLNQMWKYAKYKKGHIQCTCLGIIKCFIIKAQ